MPLTTVINAGILATLTSPLDLGTASAPFDVSKRITLATGTGNGQADLVFTDTRTVAASGTDPLDLVGSLAGPLGGTMAFVKLKALFVRASSANTNNVRLNRPATNGVPLFLAASGGMDILPGGVFLWAAPTAAGVTVTAATGDLINLDNSGSGTAVTYDVVIIGTSA